MQLRLHVVCRRHYLNLSDFETVKAVARVVCESCVGCNAHIPIQTHIGGCLGFILTCLDAVLGCLGRGALEDLGSLLEKSWRVLGRSCGTPGLPGRVLGGTQLGRTTSVLSIPKLLQFLEAAKS